MDARFTLVPDEIEITAIRAQGAGGQNINKVSNAVHLRFDIAASSLPDDIRMRLLQLRDHRISKDGVVIIKAQKFRSLEKNRAEALCRLEELIESVAAPPRARRATRPTRASITRRLEGKAQRASVKMLRAKVSD
ncbi:MAG: aminoacyl-tRNA hydrolase [Betaproteobacteria bacterium]|nr:MAG: aminoacyl-tRNA hydrolase [Betaproteobacteria bacterium]